MRYFFSKTFAEFDLDTVEYWKCGYCGFCASKTHLEMSETRWAKLNDAFHSKTHHAEDNPYNRNQRYFNQALMLSLLRKQDAIGQGKWLDWGCGIGAVSKLLQNYFDVTLSTYDRYFLPEVNVVAQEDMRPRSFDLVLNTAVFEHVRARETLDEIESYVAPSGAFAIHTLVPEHVPQNPDWMYLLPVHCAFHTNRSMQILMEQWGYQCSVYNEHAKLWVLFRQEPTAIESKVEALNKAMGWSYVRYKAGFMDYWK
ncbi:MULTISPECIES: class I SAM-dependent methyltransferase [unclassified Caballeronia]|uniref:class I SAM-dependent methyltransferase n=1 Tax=unclassified Caballeronia TaxID=2646786 RepID=UPI00202771AD|nr:MULTISPECIES: class I SAM-dependent methyltransferase [unclassified Caballeronia]